MQSKRVGQYKANPLSDRGVWKAALRDQCVLRVKQQRKALLVALRRKSHLAGSTKHCFQSPFGAILSDEIKSKQDSYEEFLDSLTHEEYLEMMNAMEETLQHECAIAEEPLDDDELEAVAELQDLLMDKTHVICPVCTKGYVFVQKQDESSWPQMCCCSCGLCLILWSLDQNATLHDVRQRLSQAADLHSSRGCSVGPVFTVEKNDSLKRHQLILRCRSCGLTGDVI